MSRIQRRGLAYYLDATRIEAGDVLLVRDPKTQAVAASVVARVDGGRLRFFVKGAWGGARETQLDFDADLFTWPQSD